MVGRRISKYAVQHFPDHDFVTVGHKSPECTYCAYLLESSRTIRFERSFTNHDAVGNGDHRPLILSTDLEDFSHPVAAVLAHAYDVNCVAPSGIQVVGEHYTTRTIDSLTFSIHNSLTCDEKNKFLADQKQFVESLEHKYGELQVRSSKEFYRFIRSAPSSYAMPDVEVAKTIGEWLISYIQKVVECDTTQ